MPGHRSGLYSIPSKERKPAQMQQLQNHLFNKSCQQGVVNKQHNEMHADSILSEEQAGFRTATGNK